MVKIAAVVVVSALAAGCSGQDAPTAVSTVTVTATVTADPVPEPGGSSLETAGTPGRRLDLTVFTDGCGVIRSESSPGEFRNLTWVFRDADGFQVLGRNATGETRYRFFQPGTFAVVLEAWAGDHYAAVSNTVTVEC